MCQQCFDVLISALNKFRIFPAGIYFFKVNNGNTKTMCEICSKLTMNTPELRQWRRSGVVIVNFEQISNIVLVFPLLTLSKQMRARLFFRLIRACSPCWNLLCQMYIEYLATFLDFIGNTKIIKSLLDKIVKLKGAFLGLRQFLAAEKSH